MTNYHLHNRFLNTLHPYPFPSRQAAEAFRDTLGCDDDIVEREVEVMDEDETAELELDLEVEDELNRESNDAWWEYLHSE